MLKALVNFAFIIIYYKIYIFSTFFISLVKYRWILMFTGNLPKIAIIRHIFLIPYCIITIFYHLIKCLKFWNGLIVHITNSLPIERKTNNSQTIYCYNSFIRLNSIHTDFNIPHHLVLHYSIIPNCSTTVSIN